MSPDQLRQPNQFLNVALVGLALALAPLLIWLAIVAKTNTADLNNWIDTSSDAYHRYQTFLDQFGSDDQIILSWNGCRTTDPRLPIVANVIRETCSDIVDRVTTGTAAVDRLVQSAAKISDASARRRLRGSLFGDDLTTTCVIARLNQQGKNQRSESVQRLETILLKHISEDRDDVHLGGKAFHSHSLNHHTNRALLLGIPGAFLAALITWLGIRSWRFAMSAVFVAGYAGLFSLAIVPLFGVQLNGLLVLMPVLVFVLALGGAVHRVRAVQRELAYAVNTNTQPTTALKTALKHSRPPILLSMLTTAIGIGTLSISPISAVRQFGLFSAFSLIMATVMLLTLLPTIWRIMLPKLAANHSKLISAGRIDRALETVHRFPIVVLLVVFAAGIPAVIGLQKFETDLDVARLFSEKTSVAKDTHWIEKNLFPQGRVDMVVSFPKSLQLNRYLQLVEVLRVQSELRKLEFCNSCLSAANFVSIPRTRSTLQRHLNEQLIANQIDTDYETLQQQGLLSSDESVDRWRISVACFIEHPHDEFDRAEELMRVANQNKGESGISLSATGMGPVSAQGQRRLFSDLMRSLGIAVVVIIPLIIFSLRSWKLGALAMIPNLFPIVIVFGYFGFFGQRLDIGAVLTASVGLGIAIDDTVHFLHYYRIGQSSNSTIDAVQFAIQRCASPILTTTLIICGGLILFSFSQFLPVRNFAVCLILLMSTAAFADLILLPVLMKRAVTTS